MRKVKWDVLLQCCTWHLRLFYRRIIPQWCLLLLMAWTKSLSALNLEMCVTSCRPREREAPDANSSVWKLANWVVDFFPVYKHKFLIHILSTSFYMGKSAMTLFAWNSTWHLIWSFKTMVFILFSTSSLTVAILKHATNAPKESLILNEPFMHDQRNSSSRNFWNSVQPSSASSFSSLLRNH